MQDLRAWGPGSGGINGKRRKGEAGVFGVGLVTPRRHKSSSAEVLGRWERDFEREGGV